MQQWIGLFSRKVDGTGTKQVGKKKQGGGHLPRPLAVGEDVTAVSGKNEMGQKWGKSQKRTEWGCCFTKKICQVDMTGSGAVFNEGRWAENIKGMAIKTLAMQKNLPEAGKVQKGRGEGTGGGGLRGDGVLFQELVTVSY